MISSLARTARRHWVPLGIAVLALAVCFTPPLAAQAGKAFIVQTNSAGDSVSLIDPVTDRIVAEIPDAEVIHGVAAAPDGSRLYLTNESTAHAGHRRHQDAGDHEEDPADRRSEQHGDPQGRPAAVRRHHGRQGGVDVIDTVAAGEDQVHPHPGRRAQHVHHARQQVRRRRIDRRQRRDGHRHRDRAARLVDSLRRRRASALLRGEPGRLDQADVRADHQPPRVRDRRLGDAARKSAASSCPTCRPRSATAKASREPRRTAS